MSQLVAAFGLSFFAFAFLNLLLGNVNSLQIVIHQICFDILYPSNTNSFYSMLIPIATFDLLPSSVAPAIFEFDENQSALS